MLVRVKGNMVGIYGDRRRYGPGCSHKDRGKPFIIPDERWAIDDETVPPKKRGKLRWFSEKWMEEVKVATRTQIAEAVEEDREFESGKAEDRAQAEIREAKMEAELPKEELVVVGDLKSVAPPLSENAPAEEETESSLEDGEEEPQPKVRKTRPKKSTKVI